MASGTAANALALATLVPAGGGVFCHQAAHVNVEECAEMLPFRQKRGGHVVSKGRLFGAQMTAYLADGHWLELARHANGMADRLARGLGALGLRLPWPWQINEVFAVMPRTLEARLRDAGAIFYEWESVYLPPAERPAADDVFVRLVCSFATRAEEVDRFLAVVGD